MTHEIKQYFFEQTGKYVFFPEHPSSKNVKVKCPWCTDYRKNKDDKSLSVNIENGLYHCHNCEKKGVALQQKAVKQYVRPQTTHTDISQEVYNYLTIDRKLPATITDSNLVGSGFSHNGGHYVTYNYYLNDRHVNTKYRSLSKKHFRMETGAQLCLYNGDVIRTASDYLIITEGEPDCLSWISLGYLYATSVPNGASNNTSYLDPHIDGIEKIETVYIAGDQDHPGYALALTLADRIGREKCKQIRLPVGIKDTNEVLQKYDFETAKQILTSAFENAIPFPIEGVESVEDNLDEAYTYLVNGYPETLEAGVPGVNTLISWFPSEVTIVTGAPGCGKSNLVDSLTVSMMNQHGMRVAFVSAEKSVPLHIAGLVRKHAYSGIVSPNQVLSGLEKLNDHFFYITGDGLYSLDDILIKTERLVKTRGVKVLVIDNLSCINQKSSASISDNAAELMSKIKSLAKKYRLIVLLVAHPRKQDTDGTGYYNVPTGYDILGSSHYYNLTDNIIAMALKDGYVEIATRKIKNMEFVAPQNKLGSTALIFDRTSGGNYKLMPWGDIQEKKNKEEEKEHDVFDLF